MQRTFHIQHTKDVSISIDTDVSKFDTVEALILALFRHYRDRRPEQFEQFKKLLDVAYENAKLIEEFNQTKGKRKNKTG